MFYSFNKNEIWCLTFSNEPSFLSRLFWWRKVESRIQRRSGLTHWQMKREHKTLRANTLFLTLLTLICAWYQEKQQKQQPSVLTHTQRLSHWDQTIEKQFGQREVFPVRGKIESGRGKRHETRIYTLGMAVRSRPHFTPAGHQISVNLFFRSTHVYLSVLCGCVNHRKTYTSFSSSDRV